MLSVKSTAAPALISRSIPALIALLAALPASAAALFVSTAALFISTAALGDGKFFSISVAGEPTIPDQQAMIVWDGAIETLIIDTSVRAQEGELCWVVPVPAPPEIEAVDTGLFPTLAALTAARIRRVGADLEPMIWMLAVLIVALGVEWIALGSRSTRATLGRALLLWGMITLLAAVFLPTQSGSARGGITNAAASVRVLDQRRVGAFDTTVVTADEPEELIAWLTERGFVPSEPAREAIAGYTADDWCFVLTRLAAPAGGAPMRPHPLALRFPSPAPVYPMRLTGVENGDLQLRLYVFGPDAAQVDGLHRRVALPLTDASDGSSDSLARDHDRLRDLPAAVRWCSVLEGALAPADQAADLLPRFVPAAAHRPLIFSEEGARRTAMVLGLAATAGSLLTLRLFRRPGPHVRRQAVRAIVLAALAGTLIGWGVHSQLDSRPTQRVRFPEVAVQVHHVVEALESRLPAGAAVTAEAAAALFERAAAEEDLINPWTGARVRVERSPGNVIFRDWGDGAVEVVTFDSRGREFRTRMIWTSEDVRREQERLVLPR